MSPLSDTTNLAPAIAGTDLFTHIKHMLWTTVPSISIALIVFLIVGFVQGGEGDADKVLALQGIISEKFNISGWLFLVPITVIALIIKKVPTIPALFIGALLGGVFAVIFQPDVVKEIGSYSIEKESMDAQMTLCDECLILPESVSIFMGDDELISGTDYKFNSDKRSISFDNTIPFSTEYTVKAQAYDNYGAAGYKAIFYTMALETTDFFAAENSRINDLFEVEDANRSSLLKAGGMYGMMNTVWLIICALTFGGAMQAGGFLKRITKAILSVVNSTGSLIASTAGTCFFFNLTASDQYIAIVVPGKMFKDAYKERGLAPENLSRVLEDSGTVTSVLIPWNTCGVAQSGVLGVATGTYWIYCIFNLVSPLMTIAFGIFDFKIKKLREAKS